MSTLLAGTTVCDGRYRLDEVVGRGGMAIVWRATDLQLERTVAIKIISDVLAGDERFAARFEREARLAAGLNHPNLVKVYDFSSEEGRPLLVMEYIPGGTLVQRSADVDATELARDLLDALAHIHGAGILHRDIKPANVLLDAEGSPRLTDFGIARSDDQTGLTLTGQVMGTLRYIAPEVAEGKPATPESDIYSLGVLLTGVAGEEPPKPLAGLLARMTAKEPDHRPRSADEALAELEPTRPIASHRARLGTYSVPDQAQYDETRALHAQRRIRIRISPRTLAVAAAAAAAALLIVVVLLVSSGGSDQPTKAAPQPAPAGTPLNQQLDQLNQIIRQAPAAKP